MKVYVFVEAYTPEEEYADILQTKVFLREDEAKDCLKKQKQAYLDNAEDGERWKVTFDTNNYFHAIYDGNRDEVVMTIDVHEI